MTREIADKIPKTKSIGVTSWNENTGNLQTGCELSTSNRWVYKTSHVQMSEKIPAKGQSEEISRQFLVCTHNHFDYLLDFIFISYLPNPSARSGYDTRSIFKRSLTGLNSEFSFSLTSCLTKAEEPSLSYYLPIAGGRIIGFIPFPRVLVLCEMQSVQDLNSCRRVQFLRR